MTKKINKKHGLQYALQPKQVKNYKMVSKAIVYQQEQSF